jgi:hypothetical protein
MELLCDVGQEEARFYPFRDCVNLGARYVLGLCRTYRRLVNHFGHYRWYSYMKWLKWKLVSFHLEIVLISTQERCTVCGDVP